MNKKQKKALWRIIAATVMVVALELLPVEGWLKFALYLIPYLTIGYETLIKAFKGLKTASRSTRTSSWRWRRWALSRWAITKRASPL